MRGELCIGVASLLSFAATLLLIFAHVGQTNHNSVARGISLVNVNVSGFGLALRTATGDPTPSLYNNTPYAPLGEGLGLRQLYQWGFYGHCAYVDHATGQGVCTAEGNGSFGYPFDPFQVFASDIPQNLNYSSAAPLLIPPSKFRSSDSNRSTSRAGFYLIFIGSIATAAAFLLGLIRHNTTFTLALGFSSVAALLLLIGTAVWTALIQQQRGINTYRVFNVPLGITVTYGIQLWLIWAAFALNLVSILPYFLSWYTYRKRFI